MMTAVWRLVVRRGEEGLCGVGQLASQVEADWQEGD